MKLFPPGPFRIGNAASARLRTVVRRGDEGFLAKYLLEPINLSEYGARIGSLGAGLLGQRYAPLLGVWVSFVAADRNAVELWVGLDPRWGQQMNQAALAMKVEAPSVVSEGTLRALALGYLQRSGV